MKRSLTLALVLGIVLGITWVALATGEEVVGKVLAASTGLRSFRATIHMTSYEKKKAEIEFAFEFVPPGRMRIEYTYPANLAGQLVILNGDRLYTYLPLLHRAVHRTVSPGARHPGTEMGFLYFFVEGSLPDFLEDHAPAKVRGPEELSWEHGNGTVTYRAYRITFSGEGEKEVVWCDVATFVPVAVDIYRGGKLSIAVRVVDYEYNGEIPPEDFAIPE